MSDLGGSGDLKDTADVNSTEDLACVVAAKDTLGESVVWCPRTRRVWWLDIRKPALQSYDPATGAHRVIALPGRTCGNLALRTSGGFVLALDDGLHGFDPETGATTLLGHAAGEPHSNRYNDGRCDRAGRLWIGTMDRDIRGPFGRFYRVDTNHSITPMIDDLSVPNSTVFSPDNRTMYLADTPQHLIWAFDFDLDAGALSRRRVFVDLRARKGLPDGSCIDADGYLWNAEYGGHRVVRYAPDGRVDRTIMLPVTNATCCCFGGDGLDTLYVTSASQELSPAVLAREPWTGGLLALRVGVRGLPEAMYGG